MLCTSDRERRMSEFPTNSKFGRVAFGEAPSSYHATRPGYPDWVFEAVRERCHLAPGTATFEIGAGTGLATRRLLDCGANPLLAIEPDARLAAYLRPSIQDTALSVMVSAFEDAVVEVRALTSASVPLHFTGWMRTRR
jgi:hypothetical protein